MRRRIKVSENMEVKIVFYNSSNLLLLGFEEPKSKTVFVVCEGLSMSVDDENVIYQWDPGMTIPKKEEYSELNGDIILMYFPFECEGLEKAGEELSDYINWNMDNYDNIILIGHSKAGVCFANMAKCLERQTTIITVSAPFLGTKITELAEVEREFNTIEYEIYSKIYSNHNVDKDIRRNSIFLRDADFSGIEKHRCINIISEIKRRRNIVDIGCWYLNKRLKYYHGDGVVEVYSQEYLNRKYPDTVKVCIDASHANSLYRILSKKRNKYIID